MQSEEDGNWAQTNEEIVDAAETQISGFAADESNREVSDEYTKS